MPTGRPPKPKGLHVIEGTKPRDRDLNREVKVDNVAPDKPDNLSPVASEEWDKIVPQLETLGLIATIDERAIRMYCETVAKHDEANQALMDQGVTHKGYRGPEVKHPAWQIYKDTFLMLHKILVEFGMTPSSRGRIQLPSEEDKSAGVMRDILGD